ncbi:aberrant root formation protein 4 isoform X1 [Pistacia vera]|uniref:aberrant root formation protein 4 isoform X1 n=1 Tax=Pistacia vera TaxID=55513 RepID=UPI001263763B|nr:aberrant root formation protein 4 isoform X1 [Pistacia vera]
MLAPQIDPHDFCSDQPLVLRLQDILTSISKEIECGNIGQSEILVSELVKFLDSIESDHSNDDIKNNAYEVLSEIYKFLSSSSLDQAVIDALSFELPKTVTRFAGVSSSCSEIVNSVIDRFVATCSPRDMLSILCEALDSLIKTTKLSDNFVPLLSGLSKVLLLTQRRHFEQVKVAVPVILKVLMNVSSESDDENTEPLFDRAIGIADSIHAVCAKLDGGAKEKLCALLGLYVLQIMVLVSISMECKVSKCVPLISQLSHFFPFCRLSYFGLITGCDVDTMTNMIIGEDEDDYKSCISYVEQGASLSVIWGHVSDQVAQAAEEDLTAVKSELKSNQTKKWQAIGMLKHILSSGNLPYEFKEHAINFLLDITDENISQENDGDHNDFSSYMPSVFAALQAVVMVIIYSPSSALRKKTFDAFKRVVAEIPRSEKRDFLKAMIINCNSPSMVAILLDLVRQEVLKENQQRTSIRNQVLPAENIACADALFWPAVVLELVDLVLRPQKGGPPLLPEHGDAVLSALNLYRFVLLTESKEESNSEVLSKSNLQRAYHEWLLPLRTLVTGIMTENKNDCDEFAVDTVCTLNPVELVLYRCIELVEEKLKHST